MSVPQNEFPLYFFAFLGSPLFSTNQAKIFFAGVRDELDPRLCALEGHEGGGVSGAEELQTSLLHDHEHRCPFWLFCSKKYHPGVSISPKRRQRPHNPILVRGPATPGWGCAESEYVEERTARAQRSDTPDSSGNQDNPDSHVSCLSTRFTSGLAQKLGTPRTTSGQGASF